MGTILVSLVALSMNRWLNAMLGIPPAQTLILDLVVLGAVGGCEGVLFHSGFFSKCVVGVVAVGLALALPGHERAIFAVSIVLALAITLITWTRWRSELLERPRR
jgi:hypothetical protein